MRKTLCTTAIIGSLLMYGLPARAENPMAAAKGGTADYVGSYALGGVYAGVTGAIDVSVNFGTRSVGANLTIPSLVNTITSPPVTYTPTGTLTKQDTYTLTQGVSFSGDINNAYISLSGTLDKKALNTSGTFSGNFCVECGTGIITVRSVTGTFSAKRSAGVADARTHEPR